MLTHRPSRYTDEKTLIWLTWLGRTLTQRGERVFYLDRLDERWVASYRYQDGFSRRAVLRSAIAAGAFLGVAATTVGYAFGVLGGRSLTAIFSLASVIILFAFGTHGRSVGGIFRYGLEPVEQLRWSWKAKMSGIPEGSPPAAARWIQRANFFSSMLDGGTIVILLSAFDPGRPPTNSLLIIGFVLMFGILAYRYSERCLVPGMLERRAEPNEGIRRSCRLGLLSGAVVAAPLSLVTIMVLYLLGLSTGRAILTGLALGLYFGLGRAFQLGWSACIRYWNIRYALTQNKVAPLRYKRFLHDAEQRILLQRIGSGFAFPHRLIQEHLNTAPDAVLQRLSESSRP